MLRQLSLAGLLLFAFSQPSISAPAAASPGRLADDLSAFLHVTVGPPVSLAGGELRVGRATLRPASGSVRPLLAAGRAVGILMEGAATMSYVIEDPFSIPVARRNLRASTGLTSRIDGKLLRIDKALSGAAVWGFGLIPETAAPPATGGAAEGATVQGGGALPAWLKEILEKKTDDNPERDLLISSAQGDAGYRWAALHAAGDDYLLDVDPQPAFRQETLARFRSVDRDSKLYGGRLYLEELAAQPIASTWWDPKSLDFATIATDIDLVNPAGADVTIVSKLKVIALRDGIRLLPFRLRSKFEDSDRRVRELKIDSLTLDGAPADFVHSEGSLLIALPKALHANETVALEVRTSGDILDRPEGNSYWILRTESWYPKPQEGGAEHSTFRIRIEVPDPFVAFASGEVVSREKTATGSRVTTKLDVPSEYAVAIAGKYTTFDHDFGGARVHVSTYASSKPAEAERLAGIVMGVRTCLENWLGVPFPFQDLQLVEIEDWGWGQAPPGVIFITKEAFMTPARAQMLDDPDEAAFYTRGVNERVAHEVAHSWFPHVAKVRRAEDNWLSESFADYSSIECLRKSMTDKKQGEFLFQRAIKGWKFGARDIGDGGSVYLATHMSGTSEKDAEAWQALLYSKGPLVIHALREELRKELGDAKGDAAFLTWIRAYMQNFTYKTASTRHLVGILDQITGKSWQPWFEKYVYGTEMPKVN
ncbi:MAG: M1 family aminopeptidase [Thermoanaerobaculia bacterium]